MIRAALLTATGLLMAVFVFAQAASQAVAPAITPVKVTAYDERRQPMGTGLALIWDNQTFFCSFRLAQGASFVRVEGEEGPLDVSKVVSYSRYFDFVVLQAGGALAAKNPLGNSDAIGVGDPVFMPVHRQDTWTFPRESVRSWNDSGKGYQLIMTDVPAGPFESCPMYNRDGKEVGWMFSAGKAIPVRDLDRFVSGKTGLAALTELDSAVSLWEPKNLAGGTVSPTLSTLEPRVLRGTVQFPFQISFPKNWKVQVEAHERMFVVRTWEESMGLGMELRVIPQQDEDLPTAIERAETLMFSGMARCNFAPYSARRISGFLACYDHPDPARHDSIRAFFGMLGNHLYVVTITFPDKWGEQAMPLLEHTLDTLQM
jgi:hypothetical protein